VKTVWKFPISLSDDFEIVMPVGSKILSVQMQGDTPMLWALCNDEFAIQPRRFGLYGTGHQIRGWNERFMFHGTFQTQMYGESLVFHLFEKM